MKRPAPYVPLSAHYADDEKVILLGEDAELMYVRMLAYAARTPRTEGWVSEIVILTRLGLLERPSDPESSPRARLDRLEESELILREGTGYRIASWLKWNRSAEQVDRERTQDRERKRAATSAKTGNRPETDRNVVGIRGADTDTDTDKNVRDDVAALCSLLADRIEGNGSKRPVVGKRWQNEARLLLDADKRPLDEARRLINWCQDSEFWRPNVLSMGKFREKYDTLRLQAAKDHSNDENPYAHLPAPKNWDAIRAEAQASRSGGAS